MDEIQVKSIYTIGVILNLILCAFAIGVRMMHLFGSESMISIFMLGILSFLNICEYKKIVQQEVLSTASLLLIAVTIVVCAVYIFGVFFFLGRMFIRKI